MTDAPGSTRRRAGLANTALAGALDDCNRALKRRPGNPGFLDSRGLVRYRMKDYAGAKADYDAALAAVPSLTWTHLMRGLTRLALGDAAGKAEADEALKDKETAAQAKAYGLGG